MSEVYVSDGRLLKVVDHGTVGLITKLPGDKVQKCELRDVLYVPELCCNLLSVVKMSQKGKSTEFDKSNYRVGILTGRLLLLQRADQACACKMPRADVASLTKY